MLIGETVNEALNEQIGYEFSASLQYVAIAAYFETEGLTELADLFHQQSTEERDHAMRFVKYVTDAGGSLKIPAIPAPRAEFTDACDAIALSLESEQRVTQQINSLVNLAISEGDHITQNMLNWFVASSWRRFQAWIRCLRWPSVLGIIFYMWRNMWPATSNPCWVRAAAGERISLSERPLC